MVSKSELIGGKIIALNDDLIADRYPTTLLGTNLLCGGVPLEPSNESMQNMHVAKNVCAQRRCGHISEGKRSSQNFYFTSKSCQKLLTCKNLILYTYTYFARWQLFNLKVDRLLSCKNLKNYNNNLCKIATSYKKIKDNKNSTGFFNELSIASILTFLLNTHTRIRAHTFEEYTGNHLLSKYSLIAFPSSSPNILGFTSPYFFSTYSKNLEAVLSFTSTVSRSSLPSFEKNTISTMFKLDLEGLILFLMGGFSA